MKHFYIMGLSALLGISLSTASAQTCSSYGNATAKGITYYVNGTQVSSLNGKATMGSTVKIVFSTASNKQTTRFSLVSYTSAASTYSYATAKLDKVYDYQTIDVPAGATKTLIVRVPYTYFEVDFVYGCVLTTIGPDNTNNYYDKQNRLITQATGGDHLPWPSVCDTCKKLTICHTTPGTPNTQTISVSKLDADWHIATHGDYVGACGTGTSGTGKCLCDYNSDGKDDRLYGVTFSSPDNSVSVKFSGDGDTATVTTTFVMDSLSYTTSSGTTTYSNVNSTTKKIISSNPISSVNVMGNQITNLDITDPNLECDCQVVSPFPVTMTSFTGEKIGEGEVELKWSTASEINNNYFVIEKSTDIANWQEVQGCRIPGHGTTQEPHNYSCVDTRANEGGQNLVYYRPKQVDYNGAYEYFNTIKIRLENASYPTVVDDAYPNPASDRINVRYSSDDNGTFNIRLLSIDGKNLLQNTYVAQKGQQVVNINLPETMLKSGFYILEVQSDSQVFRQKIYKQ